MEIIEFEHFGIRTKDQVHATRYQIQQLYQVPKKTLSDNIKMLKKDGLINGAKIRTVAKDGKQRFQEVFTLEETIAIGFRLRNDVAIRLQRYATIMIAQKIKGLNKKNRLLEIELSYMWNRSDNDDLYS